MCLAGEPMDSVCDQAGPREPSNACPSQVQRAAITDIQKELPECPAATEARKEAGDGAPADSVTPRKDPESVAGERATAGAPRAGEKSHSQLAGYTCHSNLIISRNIFVFWFGVF